MNNFLNGNNNFNIDFKNNNNNNNCGMTGNIQLNNNNNNNNNFPMMINNENDSNQNQYSITQEKLFEKFGKLLDLAEKHLSDINNVNYYLYQKYYLNHQDGDKNIDEKNEQYKNLYFSTVTERTQDPNVNKITTLQVTSSFKEEYVDFNKISSGEEKRTAVKVLGTNLPKKGGESILKFLENLKMGLEDGQSVYDMVYLPKKQENSVHHQYFMVNFKKSVYILNFYEAMKESFDKKEANDLIFSWFQKQDDKLRSFLDGKRLNKKCKDFIYLLE